jgi:hypothetical protein
MRIVEPACARRTTSAVNRVWSAKDLAAKAIVERRRG